MPLQNCIALTRAESEFSILTLALQFKLVQTLSLGTSVRDRASVRDEKVIYTGISPLRESFCDQPRVKPTDMKHPCSLPALERSRISITVGAGPQRESPRNLPALKGQNNE